MSRYFLQLAYNGAAFNGWQRQPNAPTVQQTIEEALSLMLRSSTEILGCGRTDTGVHATDYFAHFDASTTLPTRLVARLNRYLPSGISIKAIYQTPPTAHARFDARLRSYRYEIVWEKDPFRPDTVTVFPFASEVNQELLHATAALIASYSAFAPFCKSNSDAKTMDCNIQRARWDISDEAWTFHISANRFLRGMVRLIVGCCLEVGRGKLSIASVQKALEDQTPLPRSWSAPAAGLFLTQIEYPRRQNWVQVG